jgi:hypothetical protein
LCAASQKVGRFITSFLIGILSTPGSERAFAPSRSKRSGQKDRVVTEDIRYAMGLLDYMLAAKKSAAGREVTFASSITVVRWKIDGTLESVQKELAFKLKSDDPSKSHDVESVSQTYHHALQDVGWR